MTCRTYTKKATVFHILYIIFLTFFGVFTTVSAVYIHFNINGIDDRIVVCFTTFTAILFFSVDYFECRSLAARLYMNDEGIGVKRFNKTKVFIKWSDVKEIGIGSIPTPFGDKKRLYFSDRPLNENEKNDLITLKYHTVHFSYIPSNWYKIMSERFMIQIPEELKEKYVK